MATGRAQLIPRAERLVYRKPGEQLILNANPDKARYTPAGKVRLELSAVNEKEQPTPAVLLVARGQPSVITMADNKTDRLMPTHFLLSGEVKHPAELEHADFLLTDHPKAARRARPVARHAGLAAVRGADRFARPTSRTSRRWTGCWSLTASAPPRPFELYKLEEQRIASEFQPRLEQALLASRRGADRVERSAGEPRGRSPTIRSPRRRPRCDEAEKRARRRPRPSSYRYETPARAAAVVGRCRCCWSALFGLCIGGAGAGRVAAAGRGGRSSLGVGRALRARHRHRRRRHADARDRRRQPWQARSPRATTRDAR